MIFLNILLFFIFFPLIFCGFFDVEPNEAYIIETFGRPIKLVNETGLHWYFPIYNRFIKIDKSLQTIEIKGSSVPDLNGSPLNVSVVITYRIENPLYSKYNVYNY